VPQASTSSLSSLTNRGPVQTGGVTLLTVGHGTLSQADLGDLLRGADVELLVDVRTAPGSRRHPHVGRHQLSEWLPELGIAYRWEPELGGWRRTSPESPNIALHNASFRGYADYMATPPFWAALDRLLDEAGERCTAAMCSESLWWRCHRRLLSDAAVLGRSTEVLHLRHDGRLAAHAVTDGARLAGTDLLVYDVGHTLTLPGTS
jgi:uncharacterized protein (DUF488 family)